MVAAVETMDKQIEKKKKEVDRTARQCLSSKATKIMEKRFYKQCM